MNLYAIFDIFDIIVFIMLCITSWYSWKIYKKLPVQMVTFLFIGFILSAFLQLGFIALSFIPLNITWNRFVGELTVALRAIPIGFIMVGKISLYKTVNKYINGDNNGL